jgi:hypothetical protein
MSASPSISTNLDSLADEDTSTLSHQDARDSFLTIKKSFIELALNANGKADLYFHAYLWL